MDNASWNLYHRLKTVVQHNNPVELQSLLQTNPDFDINYQDGYGLLHLVCKYGHTNLLNYLLSRADIDVNLKGKRGDTALRIACLYDRHSCMRRLLKDNRVNINQANDEGLTPIRAAIFTCWPNTVRWL